MLLIVTFISFLNIALYYKLYEITENKINKYNKLVFNKIIINDINFG